MTEKPADYLVRYPIANEANSVTNEIDWRARAVAAEQKVNELQIENVRFRKEVINRLFGLIAPLVDEDTWDEAHAKRMRRR